MCKLLFKGVRLINSVAVPHIYTTNSSNFFFPFVGKLFNDMTQEKQHLISRSGACLRTDDLCRRLLMATM